MQNSKGLEPVELTSQHPYSDAKDF